MKCAFKQKIYQYTLEGNQNIETNEFLKNQKVELKLLPRFNVDLNLRLTFGFHIRIRLEIICLQAFRRNQIRFKIVIWFPM